MKVPKNNEIDQDPFFGLKYIAFLRTGKPHDDEDIDQEWLLNFAKHQICKVRSVMWNDPIWEKYTHEEILIEYFAIKFDENTKSREEFEARLVRPKEDDIDWMLQKEAKLLKEQLATNNDTIKEGLPKVEKPQEPVIPTDFEDTF